MLIEKDFCDYDTCVALTIEEKQIHNAVHVKLQEFDEFVSLVKKMREAQKTAERAMVESDDYPEALIYINKAEEIEKQVDEWLNLL